MFQATVRTSCPGGISQSFGNCLLLQLSMTSLNAASLTTLRPARSSISEDVCFIVLALCTHQCRHPALHVQSTPCWCTALHTWGSRALVYCCTLLLHFIITRGSKYCRTQQQQQQQPNPAGGLSTSHDAFSCKNTTFPGRTEAESARKKLSRCCRRCTTSVRETNPESCKIN